jgi:hypothetical protein
VSRCLGYKGARHRDSPGRSKTPCETMTETLSLKALARRILERDTARDGERGGASRAWPGSIAPARQLSLRPAALSAPLARQSAPIVSIPAGEPGLEQPCAARRGRVQELEGAFLHFCCRCGRFAAFGYGVRLRARQLGRWYCGEHRPIVTSSSAI